MKVYCVMWRPKDDNECDCLQWIYSTREIAERHIDDRYYVIEMEIID